MAQTTPFSRIWIKTRCKSLDLIITQRLRTFNPESFILPKHCILQLTVNQQVPDRRFPHSGAAIFRKSLNFKQLCATAKYEPGTKPSSSNTLGINPAVNTSKLFVFAGSSVLTAVHILLDILTITLQICLDLFISGLHISLCV